MGLWTGCAAPEDIDPDVRRALILVLDGVRPAEFNDPDVLSAVHTALFPEAAIATQALNSGVTLTVDGHAELLSGSRQGLANFGPGVNGAWRSDVPTLFEALTHHRQQPDSVTRAVGNTVLLAEAMESRYPGRGYAYGPEFEFQHNDQGEMASDTRILASIRTMLSEQDTQLLFANLHLIDATAHAGGDYAGKLSLIAEPLSSLWRWIESTPPYAGNTLLVILADHGRHRWDEEDDWHHHGDQCNGCRGIPLLLLGPGVAAGQTIDTPVTLADVTASVAWWLDVPLPYGDGVVIDALFTADVERPTRGVLRTDAVGSLYAEQRWVDDPARRTEVWVGETRLSSADALHAEAPVLLGERMACWRELRLTSDELDVTQWAGRCASRRAGGWSEQALPARVGAALWRPSLAQDRSDRRWLADTTNYEGYPDAASVRPRLLRQAGPGWDADEGAGPEVTYPMGISLALLDNQTAWVAAACSADSVSGRDSRHIELWSVAWPEEQGQTWRSLASLIPAAESGRLERPALWLGDAPRLAALSWPLAGGIGVVLAEGSAAGSDWGEWTVLERDRALGHIAPQWDDSGALWWARVDADEQPSLCRHSGSDTACASVSAEAIRALVPADGGAWISVHVDGRWSPQWVEAP